MSVFVLYMPYLLIERKLVLKRVGIRQLWVTVYQPNVVFDRHGLGLTLPMAAGVEGTGHKGKVPETISNLNVFSAKITHW